MAAARKSTSRSSSKSKNKTGCLIWLILFLATLLLFVFNWEAIQKTLDATGFHKVVQSTEKPKPEDAPLPEPAPLVKPAGDGSLETPPPSEVQKPKNPPAEKPAAKPVEKPKPKPEAPAAKPPASGTVKPDAPAKPAMEQMKSTRIVSLYFVKVDTDGAITRHEVKRSVAVSDSPMTDALAALMAGPSADELNRSFISLIPQGTRLLSAQVRGSTAYLNFNEAFMYNKYGVEGYAGQLKQIVYTATGFTSVKDVQILIEGQKRDFLGGDGVYIGKPLSRASF